MNWFEKQYKSLINFMELKVLNQKLKKLDAYMKYRIDVTAKDYKITEYKVTYYVKARTYTCKGTDINVIVKNIQKHLKLIYQRN